MKKKSSSSSSSSLFRPKIVLPVILAAIFLSPLPQQVGFYKFILFGPFVGLLPCAVPSLDEWGFTFEDLYGNGPSDDSKLQQEYRNRLWGQTALVTGANSGTGYEISLALARLGVTVVMACRSIRKCSDAADLIRDDPIVKQRSEEDRNGSEPAIITMTVDTSSLASVKWFCEGFLAAMVDDEKKPLPLDMMFLNAGMGVTGPNDDGSNKLSYDGIELTFATNVVGHHLIYKLLKPNIFRFDDARTTPPRIILSASAASYLSWYPYTVATDLETLNNADPTVAFNGGFYAQSKLAQILWAQELTSRIDSNKEDETNSSDDENPNSVVYVNAAHPGAVATGIWTKEDLMEKTIGKYLADGKNLADKLASLFNRFVLPFMWNTEEGALTFVYLGAAVEDLQEKKIRGQYFHPQSQRIEKHPYASDVNPDHKVLREKLWKFLDDLVADLV